MIKNERQYQITRRQAKSFERALQDFACQPELDSVHPRLRRAEQEGLQNQLDDLKAEMREYEALRSGLLPVLRLQSVESLAEALIKARIAAGWSQEDLADKLGMKPQQIQRYEATDYAGASLATLGAIAHALGVGIQEDVLLPTANATSSFFFRRLSHLGIDPAVVRQRFLPPRLRAAIDPLATGHGEPVAAAILQAATIVGQVFDLDPIALLGATPPRLDLGGVASTRFKMPARVREVYLGSYTLYANYISRLALSATSGLSARPVPVDALAVRGEIMARSGIVDFPAALDYVWDLGIPVVPLSDPGAFHGAAWRMDGRNVIVLKQRTQSSARWLIDLFHELFHTQTDLTSPELAVVEFEGAASTRRSALEEWAATQFGADIALGGRAEELAEMCAREASGSAERLKSAVLRVARRESANVGVLANYLAFRLAYERPPINWWGAAANLQGNNEDPWLVARDALLARLDFSQLNRLDQELLMRALDNPEEE